MSTAVHRRFESRERDDDGGSNVGSDVSTLRPLSSVRSFGSNRTFTRRVHSIVSVENELYKNPNYDSDSDNDIFDYDSPDEDLNKSVTKVGRLDLSPESEKKRQEAYQKWLGSVIAREKERKRKERERREAELEALREKEEELRSKSGEKVAEWMRKKEVEAEKKMAKLLEAKKALTAAINKPKEFKRAINYQDWLVKKNESFVLKKKEEKEKQNAANNAQSSRSSESTASFDKWIRSASSRAKPVPMGKGLASLRGSTTNLYINPEPWKFDD